MPPFRFCFIFVVAASILTGLNARRHRQDVIDGKLHSLIQIEPVRPEQKFPNGNEVSPETAHLSINYIYEQREKQQQPTTRILSFAAHLNSIPVRACARARAQSSCILCVHIETRPK